MEKVVDFYNHYDEDNRLIRHKTEFLATLAVLNNYVKANSKILDIAAGTGAYALYYAKRGCVVDALDISPKHISIIHRKINKPDLKLNSRVHDSRNLQLIGSNTYNLVFNMGMVYHLESDDNNKCIDECIRVLKPDGILAISYVNKYEGFEKDKFYKHFRFHSYTEAEKLLNKPLLHKLCHIPVDGKLYESFEKARTAQNLSNLQSELWLEENPLGFDPDIHSKNYYHGLIVGRKITHC